MAYRIGTGPRLLGIQLPASLRGGLMMVDCRDFDGQGDPAGCCRQILGECRRRGFQGIVCDFEGPPTGCLPRMMDILSRNCAAQGWKLYVPEAYAPHAGTSRIHPGKAAAHRFNPLPPGAAGPSSGVGAGGFPPARIWPG